MNLKFDCFCIITDDSREASSTNGRNTSRTRELSRRKISETSQAIASTSHDHNYGEPSLRQSHRVQLRHQQAANELDISIVDTQAMPSAEEDPLQLPTERKSHRLRPQKNVICSTNRRSARQNRSHDYGEINTEDEESESIDSDEAEPPDSDEVDDDDDNEPLVRMLANQRPLLRTRPARNQSNIQEVSGTSSRNSRGQKRPYYAEEESDDDMNTPHPRTITVVKRRRAYSSDDVDENLSPRRRDTRNTNGHTNGRSNHQHPSDSDTDENNEPQISVSSRGRVRKISNRVKNYLLD